MLLRGTIVILFLYLYNPAFNQARKYEYSIDLTTIKDDKVRVELNTPSINGNEITFYMPKIVPGTFAIADYGRFVEEIIVTDRNGNALHTERIDANSWRISNAQKMSHLSYWVNDTFDASDEGPEIFWPAGTNIEEGKNFLLNTSGFFGYFGGMKELPFHVNVIRDRAFYGCTGLTAKQTGSSTKRREKAESSEKSRTDVFEAKDYEELIDSPVMYSEPDTSTIHLGNAQVLVGSYSPNKKITAKQIATSIRDVLIAQEKFLGGKLPVKKYAFIFYFADQPVMSYGALEHSTSSVYYMAEEKIEEMAAELRQIAAHEFFHILTPLTIHSEYFDDFDFNNPRLSEHLWMYEGVTEYFASAVRVKYGLIKPEEFLKSLIQKARTSDQFLHDVPFTDISKHAIDKYHDQFYNVYQKGALIALCLDLKLLKHSGGKYSLRDLMLDLSKKFGKDKAFREDQLFEEITNMTDPAIGEFFNRHVRGIEMLPLKEVLNYAGVKYVAEQKVEDYSLGITNAEIGVAQHENKPRLQISSIEKQNAMGSALGLLEGDILMEINGQILPDLGPELGKALHKLSKTMREKETLSYLVLRKNESGEWKEVRLSAPVKKVEVVKRHLMTFDEHATAAQLNLRKAWLGD
jgi:predicted metalloprotease with PDZ domain